MAYVPLFALANFVVAWGILAGAGGLLFGTAVAWPLALAGRHARRARPDGRGAPARQGSRGQAPAQARRAASRTSCSSNGTVAVMESRIVPVPALRGGQLRRRAHPAAATARWRWAPSSARAPKVFAYVALGGSINNLSALEVKVAVAVLVVLGIVGLVVVSAAGWTRRGGLGLSA